jgi:hypothetical protein
MFFSFSWTFIIFGQVWFSVLTLQFFKVIRFIRKYIKFAGTIIVGIFVFGGIIIISGIAGRKKSKRKRSWHKSYRILHYNVNKPKQLFFCKYIISVLYRSFIIDIPIIHVISSVTLYMFILLFWCNLICNKIILYT